MRICVTDRDIIQAAVDKAAGDLPLSRCCPIAQSLNRQGFVVYSVTPESISWVDGGLHTIPTPPVAAEWMDRYDNHHHVGPFSFELAVTAP
jgi:hypothetical protein